jgi:hypothetical protein
MLDNCLNHLIDRIRECLKGINKQKVTVWSVLGFEEDNPKISSIIKLYFGMASKVKGGEKVERVKDPVSVAAI